MTKTDIIINLANIVASEAESFQMVQGAGEGNRATNDLMQEIRNRAIQELKHDYSEKSICGENSYAVDFYIPEEKTIIEIALGLPNPASEFEKDILKAIIAKEEGAEIDTLVFISRPGAKKKCMQPGRTAIQGWAKKIHNLSIVVHDLPGEPGARRKARKT